MILPSVNKVSLPSASLYFDQTTSTKQARAVSWTCSLGHRDFLQGCNSSPAHSYGKLVLGGGGGGGLKYRIRLLNNYLRVCLKVMSTRCRRGLSSCLQINIWPGQQTPRFPGDEHLSKARQPSSGSPVSGSGPVAARLCRRCSAWHGLPEP